MVYTCTSSAAFTEVEAEYLGFFKSFLGDFKGRTYNDDDIILLDKSRHGNNFIDFINTGRTKNSSKKKNHR